MAETIFYFHNWNGINHPKPASSLIFIFIISFSFAVSQPSVTDCILDFRVFSSANTSSCEGSNWGGFLHKNCCRATFLGYLYALGQRANKSGQIFLNSTEQRNCLTSMKSFEGDVFDCGIEKLTSGTGGCSDYSVADVVNKMGDKLKGLAEDCKLPGSDGEGDQACSACLRRWEEMGGSLSHRKELMNVKTDVCKFAVLVSLTSNGIEDEKWVHTIYRCLGEQSLTINEQASDGKNKNKISTGLWILIGGLIGIVVVILIGTWFLLKSRIKSILPPGKDASTDMLPEESGCQKIPIKEVYSATNNLNVLNFIGQGNAGKVYKGILSNGRHVAIKHIINDGYVETFVREPTNILLGANFEAKLSDFGLSKVMDLGQSFVSSEVRGTFGYVDPEYQRNRRVNSYGDVYSFGIVLLQVLSGKRVINLNMKKPMPLDKMAKFLTRGGNITEFADPKLNGEYSVEAFDLTLKLALSCTSLKQQRPSMEQVVIGLEKALDISTRSKAPTPLATPNRA
ncbi:hypothetical protein HHK36_024912 [Tetracentron sinense]|uniref:Protein kinase domain-containing protein n=1 Tax=Tetracentron sinense TaxID=13715 RepID=A0A834YP07_TETSI|nr:hypothetical protein HHK36_024912 [Tetracentron sinense]